MNDFSWILIALPIVSFIFFLIVTIARTLRINSSKHERIFWLYIISLFLLGFINYASNMTSNVFIYLFSFLTIATSFVILIIKDKAA